MAQTGSRGDPGLARQGLHDGAANASRLLFSSLGPSPAVRTWRLPAKGPGSRPCPGPLAWSGHPGPYPPGWRGLSPRWGRAMTGGCGRTAGQQQRDA